MAQVKPFQWYQQEMPVAIPGMKADATTDVIDSFAAEGGINPGELVIRGTDAAKQCKAVGTAGDGEKAIGVAVHTHKNYDGTGAYYEDEYNVPVMTFGDIYVEAGDDSIAAGGQAFVAISATTAGTTVSYVSGGEGAESLPGMTYLTDAGAEGDMVVLRIRK